MFLAILLVTDHGIVHGTVLEAYNCKSYEIMETSTKISKKSPTEEAMGVWRPCSVRQGQNMQPALKGNTGNCESRDKASPDTQEVRDARDGLPAKGGCRR